MIGRVSALALPVLGLLSLAGPALAEEYGGPIDIRPASGPIAVDGDLSDPAWAAAAKIVGFFETFPGENTPPPVRTEVFLTYDARFFYVGINCEDPRPEEIRAPYVDRDGIDGTGDYVAVFLDARGDRRSAQEFRVDPRGQQTDGIWGDASQNEDLSPDFFYDAAARIGPRGWTAEMRIPFSSLRYDGAGFRNWGLLVRRNYPREFPHLIASSKIPRNSSCLICHASSVTGLTNLPASSHLTVAPYVSLEDMSLPDQGPGSPLSRAPARAEAGIDVKWLPSPGTAVDATLNPDFSQVESDVGQITANRRFAIFNPEKRPFFLEGVDLLQTPFQAVSTRTITSPRWGARLTGKSGASSYTLLAAEDRGGGSVVIPGATESALAPQDAASFAAIGRWRQDFGESFAGVLMTDRENAPSDGGGHNRVIGPDFQWRLGNGNQLGGQFLFSDSLEPDRPDLSAGWDGRRFSSRAFQVGWLHNDRKWHFRANYYDVGDGFRADDGYIPQVGYRRGWVVAGDNFYDLGPLSQLQAGFFCDNSWLSGGGILQRQCGLYFDPSGIRNLGGEIDLVAGALDRVNDRIVRSNFTVYFYGLSIDPGGPLSRISLSGFLGDNPDLVNARPGFGGDLAVTGTIRPAGHLQLDVVAERQWLNVDAGGLSARLFTAQVERVKATYNFTPAFFARVIEQYSSTRRDPSLYTSEVTGKDASFSASALLGYRLNWQTVAFLGYGDERALTDAGRLAPVSRSFFLKISYAFQR